MKINKIKTRLGGLTNEEISWLCDRAQSDRYGELEHYPEDCPFHTSKTTKR